MRIKLHILFFIWLGLVQHKVEGQHIIYNDKINYNTIHIDEANRIWLGTDAGLYSLLEKNIKKIDLPISKLEITAIGSFYNYLIIGSRNGDLLTLEPETKQVKQWSITKTEISHIVQHSSFLYIATKGKGYFKIGKNQFHHFTFQNQLTDDFVYQIKANNSEQVWSSTDNGFNCIDTFNRAVEIKLNKFLPDKLITCFDFQNDTIWFGTQQGHVAYTKANDSICHLISNVNWAGKTINDLKILDHNIIIATDSGAYRISKKEEHIDVDIAHQKINKIAIDIEGNLWYCGQNILIKTLGEQTNLINSFSHQSLKHLHAICYDSATSNIWFTPDQGLYNYNLNTGRLRKTFLTKPSILIDISSLYIDHKGQLWIGTSGAGLFVMDTLTFTSKKIMLDSLTEVHSILSISGNQEHIWISSLNGMYTSHSKDIPFKFSSLEKELNIKKLYAYQLKEDKKKNLWVATDGKGILKVTKNNVQYFSIEKGIKTNVFYSIEEDHLGQIWFNANNDGLYCLRGKDLLHLYYGNGLQQNDITAIKAYGTKYLLAVSTIGIDLIDIKSLTVSAFPFEKNGLMNFIPEFNSITNSKNNEMLIGSNNGLLNFYVPSYKKIFTPQARILEVSVMGNKVSKQTTSFDHNENYFRFKISGLINSNETIHFRYKLNGLSNYWNTTTDDEIVFPHLNPGKYEMILQASNNETFFNATQDGYKFEINEPFWKTWWFISMTTLFCLIMIIAYIEYREKQIKRLKQLENAHVVAEFESLKQQVSPHFLFNSFNTLMQVIDNDSKEKALEYTQTLSDFYRSLLSYRDFDLVSLSDEIELLKQYIYLQKMRFGKNLHLMIDLTEADLQQYDIPPLTLQLLAENAIKHNTISTTQPLEILIHIEKEYLCIKNKINKKRQEEPGEKLGLKNIVSRFKLFTTTPILIDKNLLHFEIKLPLLYNKI